MKGPEPLYFSYSFTYKVKLQTDLEEMSFNPLHADL